MAKLHQVSHRFVERVPAPLEDGVLYVSISFGTVIHKCCCGCGDKVVTPLTPVDWSILYDGQFISLYPSIGRWSARCRSHYWIDRNRVKWAGKWSPAQIQAGMSADAWVRATYYGEEAAKAESSEAATTRQITSKAPRAPSRESFWRRWWTRLLGS